MLYNKAMKKLSTIIALAGSLLWVSAFAASPLTGKIIALDAGHGGGETGAVNFKYGVKEEDVNWNVVQALKAKLEASEIGAHAVVANRLSSRKDRVNDAIAKCAALDLNNDGADDGRKCDALVSVHHNGSTDPLHDGTLAIYNEKKDKPLAEKMLAALTSLTGKSEGLENGGYGMTVYGNLVSALAEAYYITNDCEAELYLYSIGDPRITELTQSQSCKDSGYILENRIDREAQLQVDGLNNYFGSKTGGKGGRK